MKSKRGQLQLGNAPTVVIIVGLTFLVMATIAYIGNKYGAAMPSSYTATKINETLITVTETGELVANSTNCNFEDFTVLYAINTSSGTVIPSTNYTSSTDGRISFTKGNSLGFNNSNWNVTYTYSYAGIGCTVNGDLETEIANNTSIAGIVLTISLVGIILSILIGIFVIARQRGM